MPTTLANIDHLVVTASGIWIIDTKHYGGKVEKRDVGSWFRSEQRLFVAGRDRSSLVASVGNQVGAVEVALHRRNIQAPLRPALCFVDAEWGLFAKPLAFDGVLVTWPRALLRLLTNDRGPVFEVGPVASCLDEAFPPN